MENLTSITSVNHVASLNDPTIRNLLITQSYHELSLAISNRTGPCANWCTFATWASKQAGQTIRQEDLSQALGRALKATPAISLAVADIAKAALLKGSQMDKHRITNLVWEVVNPSAAMSRASDAVGRGNRKVYAEIGFEFARFVQTCLEDTAYDASNISRFCDSLKPGEPPNGQRYLRQAFPRYYQAFFEKNAKAKAELILLANLEIGFHEQTRLQPEIAEALEAAIEDPRLFKSQLLDALFPNRRWVKYLGALFTTFTGRPTVLDLAIENFAAQARLRTRKFLTDYLMELGFPSGVHLKLGHDLRGKFPEALQRLTNPVLVAFLQQVDPTTDDLRETGATDWASLPERLHFIADLFRCYHETPGLLMPPFEPAQVMALKNGAMPTGKL